MAEDEGQKYISDNYDLERLDHHIHLRLNEVSPLEHLMATFDQFISSIRQEFGEQGAGKKFEVFCKWFLENDPEWSKKVDKVWLWDEYPNKWQCW